MNGPELGTDWTVSGTYQSRDLLPAFRVCYVWPKVALPFSLHSCDIHLHVIRHHFFWQDLCSQNHISVVNTVFSSKGYMMLADKILVLDPGGINLIISEMPPYRFNQTSYLVQETPFQAC